MKKRIFFVYLLSVLLIGNFSVAVAVDDYEVFIDYDFDDTSASFDDDIRTLLYQITEGQITGFIDSLTSFGPRVTGSGACDSAGIYIANTFSGMGLDVRVQEWQYGSYSGDNIEATLNGTDDSSDQIYLVCGHYDTVYGSPGADDNAGGVAAVLAAAQVMSQYSFNNTVRFVAFSGEEQGLFGSGIYAQEAVDNGDNIQGVLNADMIGYTENDVDKENIRVYAGASWIVSYTDQVSDDYSDLIGLNIVTGSAGQNSDHWPFIVRGFSAVMYHEYKFNAYYHSPQDTIDNMDLDYNTRVVRLIVGTLAGLAGLVEEDNGGGGGGGSDYIRPIIFITNPYSGATVKDTIFVSGGAVDLDGGYVKWVLVKIGQSNWIYADVVNRKGDASSEWSLVWDTNSVPDGSIVISAVAVNNHGFESGLMSIEVIVYNEEIPDPVAFLDGGTSLQWQDIKKNVVIYGEIFVENVGDPESILSWNIVDFPSWGEWIFYPSSGSDLKPEDGIFQVNVEVLTPNEEEQNFSGSIKLVNVDDPSNYVIIPVSLTVKKSFRNLDIFNLLEDFPRLLSLFEFILLRIGL